MTAHPLDGIDGVLDRGGKPMLGRAAVVDKEGQRAERREIRP
jgi:hypothetical protein